MHFWCTKKVKTFGSGQGKGKISYAWSRLYKMLSATYCVYAHRGWIGLKDSRPKVQDFHVNVPSWSFQQTLDWKHFVNSLRRGNTLNSIHVHRSWLVAWSVQFRVTVIPGEKRGGENIQDIERGKGNPSLSTISRILDVLGMEVLFRVRQTVWNKWWDNWMYIWMTERPVYWLNGIQGVDICSVTMRTTWLRMALQYQSRCRNWGFLSNRRFYSLYSPICSRGIQPEDNMSVAKDRWERLFRFACRYGRKGLYWCCQC